MKIVIKQENAERINQAIKEVEGKAKTRCCTYIDLITAIEEIQSTLKISKAALNGTIVTINPHAAIFAKAYNGVPMATGFKVIFTGGTWKISAIYRDYANAAYRYHLNLSDTAKQAIINRHQCF